MGFKTFAAGATLTAADVNDYLMEQAVIACTSATRPGTPAEGMTIYETDTDRMMVYSGTAWQPVSFTVATSWTPALTASTTSPTLGAGAVQSGSYFQRGSEVHAYGTIQFGTSGTAAGSGTYIISLPAGTISAFAGAGTPLGRCRVYDFSLTQYAVGTVLYYDSSHVYVNMLGASMGAAALVTHASPFAWSTQDALDFEFSYIRAS